MFNLFKKKNDKRLFKEIFNHTEQTMIINSLYRNANFLNEGDVGDKEMANVCFYLAKKLMELK